MHKIVTQQLVKEAGILATGFAGVMFLRRSLTRPVDTQCLTKYPSLIGTPLMGVAVNISKMNEPRMCEELFKMMEDFLLLIVKEGDNSSGFLANRLANQIPQKAKEIVEKAKRSNSFDVAVVAMDFERDDLDMLGGVCDDMIRNMLLR